MHGLLQLTLKKYSEKVVSTVIRMQLYNIYKLELQYIHFYYRNLSTKCI